MMPDASGAGLRQARVLVIDDEPLVRQSFRDYLEDLDCRVIEAADGEEGLERFFQQPADLVLVDLRMPRLDGLEVLHRIKSRAPDTPVVVVSGTGVIADAVEALHLGADDYLLKPLEDISILRHTLEAALERSRLLKENRLYRQRLEQLVAARTEELEQANRQLALINRRLRSIVDSTHKLSMCRDLQSFGARLLREFARNMRATGGSLYLVRETALERVDSLDNPQAPGVIKFPLKPGCVFQRAMEARQPLLITDLSRESEWVSSGWTGYRDGSLLVFPLTDENRSVAALLSLHNADDPPFVEQDREIGSILASFSCETLRNVRISDALQRSEEMFRTITGSAQDAIFTADAGGRISYWNRAAEKIFGWTEADALGLEVDALFAPDGSRAAGGSGLCSCLEVEPVASGHLLATTALRRDGTVFPAELSLACVLLNDRWSMVGIVRDISERQQVEARLRLLATAAEQAAESILVIDRDRTMVYVNPAFTETSGYSVEETVGRPLDLLEDRTHPESGYRELSQAMAAEQPWQGTLRQRRKGGKGYAAEVTLAPVRDPEGRVVSFVSVQRDVSRERELENRLLQAQKMEAIGTLAGGIAHDFNNILNAILGYSELALVQLDKASRAYGHIEKIHQAGQRAADLVKQILTISRRAEVRKRPVRIQPIVKESLKLLRSTLPSTIAVESRIDSNCGPVLADPTQIHQVIMNLCTNAFHAMRETGGTLDVTLDQVELSPSRLTAVPARQVRDWLRLTVRDTGCGMDAATVKRIFDPYFTTKAKGEGTGLGLATVQGIVERHDGVVEVESAPGSGSVFRVLLPLCPEQAMEVPSTEEGSEKWRGTGRILLVDDEPAITEVGQSQLTHCGYRVRVFNDSREAWEAFRAEPQGYDLVITDLTMPGLTGLDLARLILGLRPDLPIVICSGYSESAKVREACALGVRQYVMKPIPGSELLKTVHRLLHEPAPRE